MLNNISKQTRGFTPLEILKGKHFGNGQGNIRGNRRFLAGFTLIELLVVVAIIGLLLGIISVSLTEQRAKGRDTRRVSDVKQLKTGFDLYFSHGNGYPDTTAWVVGSMLNCSGIEVLRIPQDPGFPLYEYAYEATGPSAAGCGGTVRGGYSLQFYMENKEAYYTMDEDGVVRDEGGTPVSFDSLL